MYNSLISEGWSMYNSLISEGWSMYMTFRWFFTFSNNRVRKRYLFILNIFWKKIQHFFVKIKFLKNSLFNLIDLSREIISQFEKKITIKKHDHN